jgi:hypothetical protein
MDSFYISVELKCVANLSVSEEVDAEGFQEVVIVFVLVDVILVIVEK